MEFANNIKSIRTAKTRIGIIIKYITSTVPLLCLSLASCGDNISKDVPISFCLGTSSAGCEEAVPVEYNGLGAKIQMALDDVPEANFATRTVELTFGWLNGEPNPILRNRDKYRLFWFHDFQPGRDRLYGFEDGSVISMVTNYFTLDGKLSDYPSFARYFPIDHHQENRYYFTEEDLPSGNTLIHHPKPIKHQANMYVERKKMLPLNDNLFVTRMPLIWDLEMDAIYEGCNGRLDLVVPVTTITFRIFHNNWWGGFDPPVPIYQVWDNIDHLYQSNIEYFLITEQDLRITDCNFTYSYRFKSHDCEL